MEQSFTQLSVKQQQDLQRDFDNVSKRIADLSDWEHYIATPRKQQLLDDINALVLCPLDNPNEQAAKVKEYRKNWNLLGHADEELDKSLNDSFNKACEDAFTPCRLFFAEQEKLREQHLKIRIELIEQAKHLALLTAPLDFKVIDGQLNKLSTAWLEVGEVDRAKYKNLQQEFNNVLQPVKQAIRDFNEQNISLKKAIIEQANEALNRDDVNASIETIKQLQTKWRNIGYAGQRYENKLWQSFRAVNDQIFKKRDDCIVDEKIQQTAQLADYENQLSSLKDLLIKATDKEKLKLLKEQTTDLLEQLNNSKPVIKVVSFALENILKEIANQSKKIDEEIANQVWQNIFILMSDIAVGSIVVGQLSDNTIYSSLPVSWQKKLFEAMSTKFIEQDSGRACKTLELEILAGIESPADLAKQRMQIQVQLMQDKMSSGNEVNIEQRFSDWLYQGILTEQDVPFINRLKPIFCH